MWSKNFLRMSLSATREKIFVFHSKSWNCLQRQAFIYSNFRITINESWELSRICLIKFESSEQLVILLSNNSIQPSNENINFHKTIFLVISIEPFLNQLNSEEVKWRSSSTINSRNDCKNYCFFIKNPRIKNLIISWVDKGRSRDHCASLIPLDFAFYFGKRTMMKI